MVTLAQVKQLHHSQTLYHKDLKNADGSSLRARVNGQLKLWKTRPNEFQLPMKHGMRDSFYLNEKNAHEWTLTPKH